LLLSAIFAFYMTRAARVESLVSYKLEVRVKSKTLERKEESEVSLV